MWQAIKNALMSVKETTGIEIPGLPADLGSIAESATTAVQAVTESATGAVAGATEAVTGGVTGVTETAATAVDSAPQELTDLTGGLTDGSPEK